MALKRVEPRSYRPDLRERESELADVESLVGFGSWEWDLSSSTAVFSDEFCRILELPLGSALNAGRFLELVHPDDRESVVRQLDLARAGEKSSLRFRVVRMDGEVRDVLLVHMGRALFAHDGDAEARRWSMNARSLGEWLNGLANSSWCYGRYGVTVARGIA